jgi:oligogalacturonide transport system permease protein
VAIYEFLWDWNNFFDPLIYINSPKKFPVALGLRMLHGTLYHVPEQHIMAMTFVSLIPVLVVFVATQRYFIQGIVVSGIKG